MKIIGSMITFALVAVIGFLLLGVALQCDHESTISVYSFQFEDSTAYSNTKKVCRECGERVSDNNPFKGTPNDQSYLEAVIEHCDSQELIPGEYYTMTATVPLGFYGYGDKDVRLSCKVENENYVVGFSVEFKEEFRELVEAIEEGEEITFRGRLYGEGFGFADSELIAK